MSQVHELKVVVFSNMWKIPTSLSRTLEGRGYTLLNINGQNHPVMNRETARRIISAHRPGFIVVNADYHEGDLCRIFSLRGTSNEVLESMRARPESIASCLEIMAGFQESRLEDMRSILCLPLPHDRSSPLSIQERAVYDALKVFGFHFFWKPMTEHPDMKLWRHWNSYRRTHTLGGWRK